MRRRLIAGLASASVLFTVPLAQAPAVLGAPSPIAQAACKRATIGGQSRCIARGQFCARQYERDYNRYGYSCSNRDRNGRWHLR